MLKKFFGFNMINTERNNTPRGDCFSDLKTVFFSVLWV